ncbi:prominin-like protein [Drosophila novamexicana]|uniref:prominin-like protein n=1 Tax=Drosophila novamexicana TaxID=47314 RepID=UPI0011E5ADC5|nr:prominin-like protein [Drosophila novamexicana]XP_030560952.1 prominin-like protein [Drosophila novamexicana]
MRMPRDSSNYLKSRTKRRKSVASLAICGIRIILFGCALSTLMRPTHAVVKELTAEEGSVIEPRSDHANAGEHLGHLHFPSTDFTPFGSKANYTEETIYSTAFTDSLHSFTHSLFDKIVVRRHSIPPGYIVVKNGDTFALGPNVDKNDWHTLLAEHFVAFLLVIFLLILIIIMPFLGVCYCCFCCCKRCSQGCPFCDKKDDDCRRLICGIILAILLIGVLLGMIIAIASNILLDHGFEYTRETMRRASQDTCTFLHDTSNHIQHLLVRNYQEMDTHMTDILMNAHHHVFLDLLHSSQANVLFDIERILNSMPNALILFREVHKLEKDLRFYGAQLRDGLRSVKRDLSFALAALCGNRDCLNFLKSSNIETMDTSKCLHFDELPVSSKYIHLVDELIHNDTARIPNDAIDRLQAIGVYIKQAIDPVTPPLIRDLHEGITQFHNQAQNMRNIIDSVISHIHFKTLKGTKSLDDVYDKFGVYRRGTNLLICVMLGIVLFLLILALIFGCFGRLRHSQAVIFCSKGTGAIFLFFAIILIFCVLSAILLVGLFYFVFGLITYQGVCAPLRDETKNAFFRQMDATIDLQQYFPKNDSNWQPPAPLHISAAIEACEANETIFNLLQRNNLYDVNDLVRIEVIAAHPTPNGTIFPANVSTYEVLTQQEKDGLNVAAQSNLSDYHSSIFLKHLCKTVAPVDLPRMITQLRDLRSGLPSVWGIYDTAIIALGNQAFALEKYNKELADRVRSTLIKMTTKLLEIDRLILYEGRPFGESIEKLIQLADASEVFIRNSSESFVNGLRQNLSVFLEDEVANYIERVVNFCNRDVGRCAPLAYIYYRGVDLICHRLVDPMNGFWLGVLICGVLLLPILFVSHRLLCLYNKIYPSAAVAVAAGGCPICTGGGLPGLPLLPITFGVCNELDDNRYTDRNAAVRSPAAAAEVENSELVLSMSSKHKQE